MPTLTTNYQLQKPLVNNATDQDLWGDELNEDLDDIDGLLRAAITNAVQVAQNATFTATASISTRYFYPCNATISAFAANLPTAASAGNGATVYFQKSDATANAITITRAGSDTIDGANTAVISNQYGLVGLVSDGVNKWSKLTGATAVFTGDSGSGGTSGLVPAPAAGDAAANKFLFSGGTWSKPSLSGAPTSAPKVSSTASYTAYSGSHTVPFNDSAPTTSNTEAILSATASVTSESTADFLQFTGQIQFDTATSGTPFIAAIFRDSETTAIATIPCIDNSNNHIETLAINYRVQASDTSPHTYTLRAGTESGAAFYINGDNSGRKYGGTLLTYLQVAPIKA